MIILIDKSEARQRFSKVVSLLLYAEFDCSKRVVVVDLLD